MVPPWWRAESNMLAALGNENEKEEESMAGLYFALAHTRSGIGITSKRRREQGVRSRE